MEGISFPGLMAMTMEQYTLCRRLYKLNTVHDRNNQCMTVAGLVEALKSDIPDMQLGATIRLRNMLDIGPDAPFMPVIEAGVMYHLARFLDRHELPQLQVEAADIFYIFANTTEPRDIVFRNDVLVAKLVNLIRRSPYEMIRLSAIGSLGTIAKDSSEFRVLVLRCKALESLLPLFGKNNSDCTLRIAAEVLKYFCRGNPPLSIDRGRRVLDMLQKHLLLSKVGFIATAFQILSCPSFRRIDYISGFGSVAYSKLVELIDHHRPPLHTIGAIKTVGNILTDYGNPLAQHLIKLGAISRLGRVLIYSDDNNVIMAACRTLANITIENCNYTQAVVSVGVIQMLFLLFVRSDIIQLKQEVALVISNFTRHGTPLDIKSASEHCIKPLCEMLDCSDNSLVLNCLIGLDIILHHWRLEMNINNNKWVEYIVMIEQANGLDKIVTLGDPNRPHFAGPFARLMLKNYWPLLAY